ncbi:recombinase family protein [Aliarcobacter cryaerophilus]|uniref:recombinase family protein n=1 Tax=Aliarcobacter cryaerophilus TaxID=28198 RepID=UPI003DA4E515
MKKIGYIKTSSKEEAEKQSEILISKGCSKIYFETSKEFHVKEKLKEALESLCKEDILVVIRLSIVSSSVQTLLETILELERKEIKLEVIEQNFNSKENYSLDELLIFLIDFVKDIKTEKRVIGIKNGKKAGRPQKLTINNVLKAIELKKYQTSAQVADKFKIGRSTLYRHIAKYKEAS